jgi:hypothetical protein
MILIHTALLCEAQIFIEYYKLKKTNINPKIYSNNNIIVLISGIGKKNTTTKLNYIYNNYTITKAVNIGIAGVNNTNIKLGSLYCTNQKLDNIDTLDLSTKDTATVSCKLGITMLYDMEAEYFLDISNFYVAKNNIFVFKIVSDYLDDVILKKDDVKKLIKIHLNKLTKIIGYH